MKLYSLNLCKEITQIDLFTTILSIQRLRSKEIEIEIDYMIQDDDSYGWMLYSNDKKNRKLMEEKVKSFSL